MSGMRKWKLKEQFAIAKEVGYPQSTSKFRQVNACPT